MWIPLLLLLPSSGLETEVPDVQAPQIQSPDVQALFLEFCASCHGETGDGKGWAELDRQARSFKDGGFSYGNTADAIGRTLRYGIPGTPMPAFDPALDDEQRAALAQYVISLGPAQPPEPTNTELVVTDRPLIVRGGLPPITAGADPRPRGMLIGTPEGLSFEYRTDDVRLLGVRSGAFCDRTDWKGRGGTPLKPLGQLVRAEGGGDPWPSFWTWEVSARGGPAGDADSRPLVSRLAGSAVRDGGASLTYWLERPDGQQVARVHEHLRVVPTPVGLATRRRFELEGLGTDADIWFLVDRDEHPLPPGSEERERAAAGTYDVSGGPLEHSDHEREPDGRHHFYAVRTGSGGRWRSYGDQRDGMHRSSTSVGLTVPGDGSNSITLTELITTDWTPAHDAAAEELAR